MANALIRVPERARPGEIIEITAMAAHPMETGFRTGESGRLVPRNIVHTFICLYEGVEVFRAELHPAITANPYLAFSTLATVSGVLEFIWTDDSGARIVERVRIRVE